MLWDLSSKWSQWIEECTNLVLMFGVMVWTVLIIEPCFPWIKEKLRLITLLDYGGILGIIGKPSPSLI
jgi:hypothetical protein